MATIYWLVCTKWFFGHGIFERIHLVSGSCVPRTNGPILSANTAISPAICKSEGGAWNGFDISGHCFMLCHASLFLWEELLRIQQLKNDRYNKESIRKLKPDYIIKLDNIITIGLYLIGALWYLMLLSTSLHFHSWLEKYLGTTFGVAFCIAFYRWLDLRRL